MERRIKKMDVIVEIRDARIPFSSANPILEAISRDAGKRIVVFNKTDLADDRANRVKGASKPLQITSFIETA